MTHVWHGDKHDVSWRVTTTSGTVDLTGSTIRLLALPSAGGDVVVLSASFDGDVVTHQLDGTLPVGRYQIVVEVTRLGEVVTYPDAASAGVYLTVRTDIG